MKRGANVEYLLKKAKSAPGILVIIFCAFAQVSQLSQHLNENDFLLLISIVPISFATHILPNALPIHNYFQQVILPRKFRTVTNNIPSISNGISPQTPATSPEDATQIQTNNNHPATQGLLLTRQALHTYNRNNNLVHYKYSAYSGSCHDLPR